MEGQLPEWLMYIAGAGGVGIAAFLVRTGWIKAAPENGQLEEARIAGAIIDTESIRELTLAVQSLTEVLRVGSDRTEELPKELRNVCEELRRVGNRLGDIADRHHG